MTIQQQAFPIEIIENNNLKPVYIGIGKKVFNEIPNFIANDKVKLSISEDYILDNSTIKSFITYWKDSNIFDYNLNGKILTNLNIPYNNKLSDNILFVVYSSGPDQITFVSTISRIVYSNENIIQIHLDQIPPNGMYHCQILERETKQIPHTYNDNSKTITLLYDDIFITGSFQTIFPKLSYVEYTCTLSKLLINPELQNIVENPLGIIRSISKEATIISIPNELYLNQALDEIEINDYGYSIIPIGLSGKINSNIIDFVKNKELENKYHLALISENKLEPIYFYGSVNY